MNRTRWLGGVRRASAAAICLAMAGGGLIGFAPIASAAMQMVTNTNDSGAGSLRAAIGAAAPGDTITFGASVTGTITLTSGALVIGENLTIDGPGASTLTISGNHASQIFFINPGAPGATSPPATAPVVNISGLTLTNGLAEGGAGSTGTTCEAGGGGAAGMGGALFDNGGVVTLTGLSVTDSQAIGGAGGFDGPISGNCAPFTGGGGGVGGPGSVPNGGSGGNLGGISSGQEGSGGIGGTNACDASGNGGDGGFGGGGGGDGACGNGGNGGFGGGGGGDFGTAGSFGGDGTFSFDGGGGGGGGGLGGAVFVRSGQLTVNDDSFTGNSATGGISGEGVGGDNGLGKGGALFINTGASLSGCATFSGNNASDAAGTGTDTNDFYSATNPACTVPGAPVGVSAMPGNTQISVSWGAPDSDGGMPITGYVVSGATSGGGTIFTQTLNNPSTMSTIIGGLTNGTAYNVSVAAINSLGTGAAAEFSGNPVTPTSAAPLITSANSMAVGVGRKLYFKVTAVGKPKPTMTASGLPSWLAFTPAAAGGSATLTGAPPVGSGGVYPITFSASNGVGFPVTQSATLSVLEFTSAPSAAFTLNQPNSFTVTTSLPSSAVALSLRGALPPNISFVVGNNGTATFSGSPGGPARNYGITLKATLGTATTTQRFTLTTTR